MFAVQPKKFQCFTSSISYIYLSLKISLLNTIEVAGYWLLVMTVCGDRVVTYGSHCTVVEPPAKTDFELLVFHYFFSIFI